MSTSNDQAVYRIRRFRREGDVPKKYEGTYEVIDDQSQQVMAVCDLVGRAVFAHVMFKDHQQQTWQMRPNRKIMPSRWTVTGPRQDVAMQFNQKIFGKMVNPLYKTALVLENGEGKEVYRLVDPRTNIPDRILGSGPDDWLVMNGDKPVAKLTRLPRPTESAKGIFGRLKRLLTGSDTGIVSAGNSHLLAAPVALAMFLLFDELTDSSAG